MTALRKLAVSSRLVVGLWLVAAYLLALYAGLRWGGHAPVDTCPGTD